MVSQPPQGVPAPQDGYPVRFDVDVTDVPRDRVTVGLRIFAAIPIVIILGLVSGGSFSSTTSSGTQTMGAAGGLLFLAPLLMIVFRQKYPKWWFDWNLALMRFTNRVGAYILLLRDDYPSTDEEQAVHLDIDYPDVPHDLNRWLPLVKWFLAIPHYFVLIGLGIASFFVVVIAWFSILFTGEYPAGMREFIVGVMRWENRVVGYALVLVTDEYPPFRLKP
jgi:hypothetical protein